MEFKTGERVGISKLLGRSGPLWRPGTITGPSPSPHWDYTIAYDDKYNKFLHATRSHVIKWTKYEAWFKKNEKKLRNNKSTAAASAPATNDIPPVVGGTTKLGSASA